MSLAYNTGKYVYSMYIFPVNPRITPRWLIYQQRYFGLGLIRAGGLFELINLEQL